ncbi:MAG: histidine kinase N-terminal 7TM domain-containing protein, partial [Hominilimicola sp.]
MTKKMLITIFTVMIMLLTLTGCSAIGNGISNLSIIYVINVVISLLLLISYCHFIKKKELWFVLLYISVLMVNIGYVALAISKNLGEALLANRISYLGAVFLPLFCLLIIMELCRIRYNKFLLGILLSVSIIMFLLAASGG